ncbi:MAG TPA: hypothetical protein VHR88_00680 [Solirubrobacteraceae bacterium]|jgi:hypothetical protein|nr:hypothetical protein [Solirubrobacteraceae bacterium]
MNGMLRLAGLALVAALAIAGLSGSAIAASAAKTTITIQTEADGFSGFVKSSSDPCQNNRKVTLYRVSGGKAKAAGSDVAQPNQDADQWKISVTKTGKYFAQTGKKSGCSVAKSKTISAKLSSS